MKYFTNEEWYKKAEANQVDYQSYNKEIEQNYQYYPDWFKKYYEKNKNRFIFHDSAIMWTVIKKNDLFINCLGIDGEFNKEFKIVLHNFSYIEKPETIDGCNILAEELYCNSNVQELHLLLVNDEENPQEAFNFTITCEQIDLVYGEVEEYDMKIRDYLGNIAGNFEAIGYNIYEIFRHIFKKK